MKHTTQPNRSMSSYKPIRRYSPKRQKENRTYSTLRKQYLQVNDTCQALLSGCSLAATDIHHKAGRISNQLNNTSDWLAVCRCCHNWIESHPREAKEKGLSKSRLAV